MSRVREYEPARRNLQEGAEDRHEDVRVVAAAQLRVQVLEQAGRLTGAHGSDTNEAHGPRHEQCSWNAMARHVAHGDEKVRVVDEERIEEVAADFRGGIR